MKVKISRIRNIVYAGTFTAIGIFITLLFHLLGQGTGRFILPMHLPVLVAGFFLPLPYTMAVAVLIPSVSTLVTGMPHPPDLVRIMPEMLAYGLAVNLFNKLVFKRVKNGVLRIYLTLVSAMLIGRLVAIPAWFLEIKLFTGQVQDIGFIAILTALFVTGLIGIVLQLITVPSIVISLQKVIKGPRPADYFNDRAAVWDEVMYHDPKKLEYITGSLELKSGDAVLDVGCGTGVLAPYLYDKCESVLGVDEAEKMIQAALKKYAFPNVEFKNISFESVTGKFDKIIMYSVFPHFADRAAAIGHAAALMKRGGRLVIAHSNGREHINSIHSPKNQLPDAEEFGRLVNEAGLKLTKGIDTDEMFVIIADKE